MIHRRRRRWLLGSITLVALLLAGAAPASASTGSRQRLDGTWLVSITGGTGTPILPDWYRARVTFTPSGGVVATITDGQVSTGHGAWTRTGDRTFAVTIVLNQLSAGSFLGTVTARATIALNEAGDEFTGDPYEFEFADQDGVPTGFSGVGVAHGSRVTVAPAP